MPVSTVVNSVSQQKNLYLIKIFSYDTRRTIGSFTDRCNMRRNRPIIGRYIGLWIAGKMGLPKLFEITIDHKPFPVLWAIIGSVVFTLIMALLRRAFVGRNY
jgi:hypothetical protein